MIPNETRIDSLPFEYFSKPSKAVAVVCTALAAASFAIPAVISQNHDEGIYTALIVIAVTLLCACVLLAAVNLFYRSTRIVFDKDRVTLEIKGFIGAKNWTESLTDYAGILYRTDTETRGSKESRRTVTVHIIDLFHTNNKRTIQLHKSDSDAGVRAKWEQLARVFALSALEESADGLVERSFEDLDKSLRERAAEGKIDIDFDASMPPERIAVAKEDGALVIRIRRGGKPVTICIGGVGTLMAGYGMFGGLAEGHTLIWLGGIALLIALGSGFIVFLTQAAISISSSSVRTFTITPWGATKGKQIATPDIETVKHEKSGGGQSGGITLATDSGKLQLARGLPREIQTWLQNCLTAAVVKFQEND